jgi:hypothetical protein
MVVHSCNPSTQEAEARGLQVQDWPGLIARPYLKKQHQQNPKNLKTNQPTRKAKTY